MALSPAVRIGILVASGLFFAVSGLLAFTLFPEIFRWQVEQKFVLSPDAETYHYWKDVPAPIYIRFYFFNVTNVDDYLSNSSSPEVEETGPYTFRETREKVNITWNENGTVSYRQIRRWYFQPDLTTGRLDDSITVLNVPMVSSAYYIRNMEDDDFFHYAISAIIDETNSTLFIKRKIRELLFEGYHDIMLEVAKEIGSFNVPFTRFGWYYGKNNSDDGVYTVFTGANGMENFGFIDRWNGLSKLNIWNSHCGKINGTTGEMWPPFSNENREKLTFFVSDICRSISLKYHDDVVVHGIKAKRYIADHTLLDNGRYDLSNKCFCEGPCMRAGVLNISACQHGSPAFVSFPHFMYADSEYQNDVLGMKPDPTAHSFFLDIEPELGLPINVAARMQINILLDVAPRIDSFPKIKKRIVFPVFWFSHTGGVDEEMTKKLIMVTEEVPRYVTVGSFLLVVVGGILLIFTFLYALRVSKDQKRRRKLQYQAVRTINGKNCEL